MQESKYCHKNKHFGDIKMHVMNGNTKMHIDFNPRKIVISLPIGKSLILLYIIILSQLLINDGACEDIILDPSLEGQLAKGSQTSAYINNIEFDSADSENYTDIRGSTSNYYYIKVKLTLKNTVKVADVKCTFLSPRGKAIDFDIIPYNDTNRGQIVSFMFFPNIVENNEAYVGMGFTEITVFQNGGSETVKYYGPWIGINYNLSRTDLDYDNSELMPGTMRRDDEGKDIQYTVKIKAWRKLVFDLAIFQEDGSHSEYNNGLIYPSKANLSEEDTLKWTINDEQLYQSFDKIKIRPYVESEL
jgi:hypothetical protein